MLVTNFAVSAYIISPALPGVNGGRGVIFGIHPHFEEDGAIRGRTHDHQCPKPHLFPFDNRKYCQQMPTGYA